MKRRNILKGIAGMGALTCLGTLPSRLIAEEPTDMRFVFLLFTGGWDILLGPDARDPSGTYSGLDLGLNLLEEEYHQPIPVSIGGMPALWGVPMKPLIDAGHHSLCTLFQSVNMNTVSHSTAHSYIYTFLSPAGSKPRGDSLGTMMATAGIPSENILLPNVALAMPSFNVSYAPEYVGTSIRDAGTMRDLLRMQTSPLREDVEAQLLRFQDHSESCADEEYHANPNALFREARKRARKAHEDEIYRLFNFSGAEHAALRERYDLPEDSAGPRTRAAIVGQLIRSGLARSVSARIDFRFDHHGGDWASQHPPMLHNALDAVSRLLSDLREDDPNLERTMVVCTSEFGRTPLINGRGGRDHHFVNSVMVFGGPLKRGFLEHPPTKVLICNGLIFRAVVRVRMESCLSPNISVQLLRPPLVCLRILS